jgi:hypothetical protein
LRQGQVNNNGQANYNRFETLNNIQFTVDGVFGTLAPTTNIPFSTGHPTITGCNELFYGVWVNNTNSVATTAGSIVDPATLTGANNAINKNVVKLPDVVSNNVLIGLIKVKVGTGVTFTPGTTNLNATNITTTFFDVSGMPTAAQQS